MNRPLAILLAYLFLGLEMAAAEAFRLGDTSYAPSFVIPFIVFIALFAQPIPTLWTALLVGLVTDLASPRGPTAFIVIGPHALGYATAAYLVLTMRGLMIRRNPLTLVVLSAFASLLAGIIGVAIFSLRSIYPDPYTFAPMDGLIRVLLSSLCTLISALVMGLVLIPAAPLMGFHEQHGRRFSAR